MINIDPVYLLDTIFYAYEELARAFNNRYCVLLVSPIVFAVLIFTILSQNAYADCVVATVNVNHNPVAIAYNPSNNDMYVIPDGTGAIPVISGTSVVGTITTYYQGTKGLAYNPSNSDMYITNAGKISVISGTSVNNTITTADRYGEGSIVYNPSNSDMYVINSGSGTVSVISGISILATIPDNIAPNVIAYNPSNNDTYVAGVSETVSVISGTTIIANLAVGSSDHDIVYNPSNNDMYVSNSGSNTVSVIGSSATCIPSTTTNSTNSTRTLPSTTASVYPQIVSSPLKQFKSRIPANQINCENGLELVIKVEDISPACVKSDTAQKLIERGWARAIASNTVYSESPQENSNPIAVTLYNGTNYSATLSQGDTIEIPWQLTLDKNYSAINLTMTPYSMPSVETSILPKTPFTIVNNEIDKYNIVVHVDTSAKPGNYTVAITGTADDIQNLETHKYTEMGNKTLVTLHLTVMSRNNQVFFHLGKPKYNQQMFYFPFGSGGGEGFEGFPTSEEVPITIFSNGSSTLHLKAENIHPGGWVGLIPDEIIPERNGTTVKMILAGYLMQGTSHGTNHPMILIGTSDDSNGSMIVPVTKESSIQILNATNIIPFNLGTIASSNQVILGIVYDPQNSSKMTLLVTLSVKGYAGSSGKIINATLPSWLSVGISKPSFILNASEPYYFNMWAQTTSAAPESGTYYVAMDEQIGNQHFTKLLGIEFQYVRMTAARS